MIAGGKAPTASFEIAPQKQLRRNLQLWLHGREEVAVAGAAKYIAIRPR